MRSTGRHTIIIGGGVIGVCCAYYLAKRGARVTVLERDEVGKAASFGNAGSITPDQVALDLQPNLHRACGVEMPDGVMESDSVVLAAGAYGASLLWKMGIDFPLRLAKGYHRDCTSAASGSDLLRHACVLGENMVFCTPMDGFVRFAGTLEFSGVNHEMRRLRLEQTVTRYLNTAANAVIRSEWCGLRPCRTGCRPSVRYRGYRRIPSGSVLTSPYWNRRKYWSSFSYACAGIGSPFHSCTNTLRNPDSSYMQPATGPNSGSIVLYPEAGRRAAVPPTRATLKRGGHSVTWLSYAFPAIPAR